MLVNVGAVLKYVLVLIDYIVIDVRVIIGRSLTEGMEIISKSVHFAREHKLYDLMKHVSYSTFGASRRGRSQTRPASLRVPSQPA